MDERFMGKGDEATQPLNASPMVAALGLTGNRNL
jgi:hypothetical protein